MQLRHALVLPVGLSVLGCLGILKKDDPDGGLVPAFTPNPDPTVTGPLCDAPWPDGATEEPLLHAGEEFMFDAEGYLVTVVDSYDQGAWKMDRQGSWTQIAPYSSQEVAGIDILLDGDIVIADEGDGALYAMASTGGVSLILGSINSPNSLAVRDDGQIYTTAFDRLLRVDPDTGETEELLHFPGGDLDGVTFTPNFDRVYFNVDEEGEVWFVNLNEDGSVHGFPEEVHQFPLNWGYQELDGMTTDVCGNVYVLRTDGRIGRITPDGDVEENWLTVGNGDDYTTSLHFGSGRGGWPEDHLYVSSRWGTLFEIDVGIRGAPEPHR